MENIVLVTIIIPIYNEEKYIETCINSLLLQDYSKSDMEWLFIDGESSDETINILNHFQLQYPELINIITNPSKTVPYAMNLGIEAAHGDYIIRLDAHADYPKDYISKCVYFLKKTDADNVGGLIETKGSGTIGDAASKVLSSRFGVGNSKFRTNGFSGYVDTVPFGAFKKEVFQKYGLYDVRLTRNQDIELNYRIRKLGGKVFLTNDIRSTYYCRNTLYNFVKMNFNNGKWNVLTMYLCPGSMGIRHFIPLFFVISLLLLPVLSMISPVIKAIFLIELAMYLSLDLIYSLKAASNYKQFSILFLLFPLLHISYGIGSFSGIFHIPTIRKGR